MFSEKDCLTFFKAGFSEYFFKTLSNLRLTKIHSQNKKWSARGEGIRNKQLNFRYMEVLVGMCIPKYVRPWNTLESSDSVHIVWEIKAGYKYHVWLFRSEFFLLDLYLCIHICYESCKKKPTWPQLEIFSVSTYHATALFTRWMGEIETVLQIKKYQ